MYKVFIVNNGDGAAAHASTKLGTLPMDYSELFDTVATPIAGEVALLNAVVGQIVAVPDDTYVHVRFSF